MDEIYTNTKYKNSFINYICKRYKNSNKKTICEVIENGRKSAKPPDQIIQDIVRLYEGNERRNVNRIKDRVDMVLPLIAGTAVRAYLDYGCGNGEITRELSARLCIEKPFGMDITGAADGIIFVNETSSLPSGFFDLITAFVSLHHIQDVHGALYEIYRLLKPGGMFIIREHDVRSEIVKKYLDLIHLFNDIRKNNLNNNTLNIQYRSKDEWNQIILSHGFELNKVVKYSKHNPQNLYFALYYKII